MDIKPGLDLTPEERANGWTPATLRKYLAERENAAAARIHPTGRKQVVVIRTFNPKDW